MTTSVSSLTNHTLGSPPSGVIGVPLGRPKLPLSPSLNISKKRTTLNFYRSSCARQVLMLVDSIESNLEMRQNPDFIKHSKKLQKKRYQAIFNRHIHPKTRKKAA